MSSQKQLLSLPSLSLTLSLTLSLHLSIYLYISLSRPHIHSFNTSDVKHTAGGQWWTFGGGGSCVVGK